MKLDIGKIVKLIGFIAHAEQTLHSGADKKAKVKELFRTGEAAAGTIHPGLDEKIDHFIDLAVDIAKHP